MGAPSAERDPSMNQNQRKLLKMFAILAALLLLVAVASRLFQNRSMTLTEYEKLRQSQEGASASPSPAAATFSPAAAAPSTPSPSPAPTMEASQLTGAILNGVSQLENRYTLAEGFYCEPLSDSLTRYITGVSYPALTEEDDGDVPAVTPDELRYVHILHYDFTGTPAEGELICNQSIALDLLEIFRELYRNEYQLERVRLIDEYDGDDAASMEDNNTSCFNYRVVEGTDKLSKHAYGLAVDVNPFYNPYITYGQDGSENVSPAGAQAYADRSGHFPYQIDEDDLCYKLFIQHGFTWGGAWNNSKDYQHFQKLLE